MWLAVFFGASVVIALTPGANNLLGMHHGVRHGARRAVLALSGRLGAFAIMIVAVVAGLGPLLAASEIALTVIKWVGVAYLVWIAVRLLIATFRGNAADGAAEPVAEPVAITGGQLVRKEFLVAISNPKALLIFTAFVPQFADPARGSVTVQLAVLGALYLLAEAIAGTAYVVIGAVVRAAKLTARARRRMDRGTGVVLLGMAGALAASKT
ncbi:LysE family translocator [Pseudonocardia sp. TRM90224]|uniref:LysE family translocator n=1 Tax=Pseudonocardia sp. TRM90224 TaxID=2812678 RepID=UPI001E2F68C8|nr:LysE family translocator [Pseudonocardia sp. TRM90224]